MTFNYTEGEKTWNPETHQVDQADGKWTSDIKAITVTNHSNVGIMAKFNFAPEGDIEGSFTKDGTSTDKLELDTIKNLDEGSAAPSDTMNFGITGGAISENCKLELSRCISLLMTTATISSQKLNLMKPL